MAKRGFVHGTHPSSSLLLAQAAAPVSDTEMADVDMDQFRLQELEFLMTCFPVRRRSLNYHHRSPEIIGKRWVGSEAQKPDQSRRYEAETGS